MSLQISILPQGFAEAERALREIRGAFPRACARAINRGLKAGRTLGAKMIRERYNIKSSDVKRAGFEIKKAGKGASLEVKGPMLPISLFGARTKGRGKKRVVTAAVIRGQRKTIRGAFKLADGRVMERRQAARTPIFPVSTIGVPMMVGQMNISTAIEKRIAEVTAKDLKANVNYQLSRAAAKSKPRG